MTNKNSYVVSYVPKGEEGTHDYIDIWPEVTPHDAFLTLCGNNCGTHLELFLGTPNTTRLTVGMRAGFGSAEALDPAAAYERTARFIAERLDLTDRGKPF